MAQWLRIRLPMQATQVWSLLREDPTCCGATKPVRHNYWACALEPASHIYWACVPQLRKPAHLEPVLRNKRSHLHEKPTHCNEKWPPLSATRENPHAAIKTQHSQKKKKVLLTETGKTRWKTEHVLMSLLKKGGVDRLTKVDEIRKSCYYLKLLS